MLRICTIHGKKDWKNDIMLHTWSLQWRWMIFIKLKWSKTKYGHSKAIKSMPCLIDGYIIYREHRVNITGTKWFLA